MVEHTREGSYREVSAPIADVLMGGIDLPEKLATSAFLQYYGEWNAAYVMRIFL